MKILITNHALRQRGGSELFTAEIAVALRDRGHEVCVFTTAPGLVSTELENQNIPLVSDPESCPFTPDIIHGQHHLEAMSTLCLWPQTPAVFMIHGSTPWEEQPPRHSRIMQYLAPSLHFGWIIERDCGVGKDSLTVIPNFFDPTKYATFRPADKKTGRALLFRNTTSHDDKLWKILEKACEANGLSLDGIGTQFGSTTAKPEDILPDYDVVFAAGRSAIEAMACGCTVIVVNTETMTERLCSENFDTIMEFNFCPHDHNPPVQTSFALTQIKNIDANETAAVTARVRKELSMDASLSALEKSYQNAIIKFKSLETNKLTDDKILGKYLLSLASKIKNTDQKRADLIAQKQRSAQQSSKWKRRAQLLDQRLRWLDSKMSNKTWWQARSWRKLKREWESNDEKQI